MNLLDKISRLRDLLEHKEYKRLVYSQGLFTDIFNEVHRQMKKKALDYSHELEFTSQDLREVCDDIKKVLKDWDNTMNAEKNIKQILKVSVIKDDKRQVDIKAYMDRVLSTMTFRRDNTQKMVELLNLLEYHSVYLYFLEMASNDEFALKYTIRFKE